MRSNYWRAMRARWTAVLPILVVCGIGEGTAAETPAVVAKAALPAHRVVLRVSQKTLSSLVDTKDVDRQVDVRDVILGTSIAGRAHVVGKPAVALMDSPEQATFKLVLNGTVHSRTTGYNGPAIIYSRSVTTFTATKQIVFEPGKGFHGLPSQVTARTQVFVEGIASTRRGLIGGIVRRRAAKMEAQRHGEATEIARQKAEWRIAETFDRSSEQRLARLNVVADFRSAATAALRAAGNGEPKYVCCTTPQYLQIASSFGEGDAAIELPVSAITDADGVPIEIWVHDSLVGDKIAAGLDLIKARVQANDFLNALLATAKLAGGNTDLAGQARALTGEQQVRVEKVGQWRVIQVEMPGTQSLPIATAHTPRPAVKPPTATLLAAAKTPAATVGTAGHRIWTSGQYTADAEFLSLDGNIVRLRRVTGINTSIPMEKLSPGDQEWIRAYLARK